MVRRTHLHIITAGVTMWSVTYKLCAVYKLYINYILTEIGSLLKRTNE